MKMPGPLFDREKGHTSNEKVDQSRGDEEDGDSIVEKMMNRELPPYSRSCRSYLRQAWEKTGIIPKRSEKEDHVPDPSVRNEKTKRLE